MPASLESIANGTNEDARFLVTADTPLVWFDASTDQPTGDVVLEGDVAVERISHVDLLSGQHLRFFFSSSAENYFNDNSASKAIYFYVEQESQSYFVELPLTEATLVVGNVLMDVPVFRHPAIFDMTESIVAGDTILVVFADANSISRFYPTFPSFTNDIQRLRMVIQDFPMGSNESFTLDGQDRIRLAYQNISNLSVQKYNDGADTWEEVVVGRQENVVFFNENQTGRFRARYLNTTFSDTEIQYLLDEGGSVQRASRVACKVLMFNHAKRYDWARRVEALGADIDDSETQRELREMYKLFGKDDEVSPEIAFEGAISSWGYNQ